MRSRPLVYLTYGDVDSPVFTSQVIGFCQFLQEHMEIPTRVVAFVPLRLYFQQKELLKRYAMNIKVLPVVNRWQDRQWYSRLNAWLLARIEADSVMTRNPVAVHLCMALQKRGWKFFYDARGCHYKELEEFSDASPQTIQRMRTIEALSWKKADWVYAVSQSLVDYFKNENRYRDHNHSVVPCCHVPAEVLTTHSKESLFGNSEVKVFCYAGSLSVWNFPRSFVELTRKILQHPENRLIILSRQLDALESFPQFSSDRCIKRTVPSSEVSSYLSISDYGILLRKKAVTNQVASPSKFADYVANGCKIIISPDIGDLSEMVQQHDLGLVYRGKKDNDLITILPPVTEEQREKAREFAQERLMRKSEFNRVKYRNLKMIHDGQTN
ncbi:MAG: hypothetical protein HKN79_12205 [Flavobacteriales bacterium]|nr:hypothetical protein [Flavobacteriales bacterium]